MIKSVKSYWFTLEVCKSDPLTSIYSFYSFWQTLANISQNASDSNLSLSWRHKWLSSTLIIHSYSIIFIFYQVNRLICLCITSLYNKVLPKQQAENLDDPQAFIIVGLIILIIILIPCAPSHIPSHMQEISIQWEKFLGVKILELIMYFT